MEIFLEKGKEHDNEIEFVRWVGGYSVDICVRVPRWEWESWGMPVRLRLPVYPA